MTRVSSDAISDRILKWVVSSVDPQAKVESVRRLPGSTSSTLHRVSIRNHQGVRDFVLRQLDNVKWLRDEPDLARHEAESLRWAARSAVPTPHIVAFDETGIECGIPAVLMTKLEGSVVLKPDNIDCWLDGLAESLARIHAVEADDYPRKYYTYSDVESLKTQTWLTHPQLWDEAIEVVRAVRPMGRECFIHRDYHPANVLWSGNKVSGVVDWINACRGPAGIDLGHCRLNLAQLFDVPTADAFLSAYQRHVGATFCYDPYWDVMSFIDGLSGPPAVYPGWPAFGVTGLTDQMMMERLEAYLVSLLTSVSRHVT